MGRDDENKKKKVGVEGRIIVDKKAKGPWDYRARFLGGDTFSAGVLGGFSWPPRSYTCSFCKRVFKSAQALGGHMNVHRRERALLRQSPPWAAQTSNPHNPNPNLSSSSFPPSQSFSHNCFTLSPPPPPPPPPPSHEVPSAQSNDPSCSNSDGLRRRNSLKALFNIEELKDFVVERDGENILKRSDLVSLDLEIGLHRDSKDDDLDLELRLGYS